MERRRACRRLPAPDEPLSRVRLRTGSVLRVIDVSDAGLLVEGTRLLPGTHVDVHVVTTAGRVLVRSRVVRAHVAALQGNLVVYRGALAFERTVDTTAVADAPLSMRPESTPLGSTPSIPVSPTP
jgi:hypothetical protein